MKLSVKLAVTLCAVCTSLGFAQIGIGTTSPDASSVLDMTSTTQGVLIPRMTTTQREAISSPAIGLQVYDTDTNSVWIYNGADWINGTGGPGKFINGSTSDIAYYDGRVGIGRDNFSTAHKLWVESERITDGTNTVARFIGRYNGTGTNVSTYAATFDVENLGSGTIGYGIGSYNTVSNTTGGTISSTEVIRSELNNPSSGSIGSAYGSTVTINNDGSINNFVVGNFIGYSGTGTVNDSYAIFINNNFNKGVNLNYSIYSASDADSYFNGNIGVGITTPQRSMHISEAMRLEPQENPPSNGALGDLYADTDGNLYFHDGTSWRQVQLI